MKKIISVLLSIIFVLSLIPFGVVSAQTNYIDEDSVVYWNGTKASSFAGGNGTQYNPYIIKTAEQLALCCLGLSPDISTGKYYKVDDTVKTFVLQPENVVDLQTLLALDSAEDVKDYLTGLSGVKNWQSQFNWRSFNGNFDGNGATIYGLYADSVASSHEDCGLFPQYDGGYLDSYGDIVPNICKNISVKNSYYNSKRRLGGIVGACYGTNYGAKVDGKVIVDSCAVINCYMQGNAQSVNHYAEQGILVGGGYSEIIQLDNVLVKDTYAYDVVQGLKIPIIGAASDRQVYDYDLWRNVYQNKVSNSIFLGVAPYQAYRFTTSLCSPYNFSNVFTDAPSGSVQIPNPAGWGSASTTQDYTNHIFQVSNSVAALKQTASTLDWENTWFMSENGPELRVFHGYFTSTVVNGAQVEVCDHCGIMSPSCAEHNFVCDDEIKGDGSDYYYCTDCGTPCFHTEQSMGEYDSGDCVTPAGLYYRCKLCDWYIVTDYSAAPGHTLTYHAPLAGNCAIEGTAEYWECSVCQNKFASNDAFAPMNTAVSDEELNTGYGQTHIKATDENGFVIGCDENGHWYICTVDGGRLDIHSNAIDDDVILRHDVSAFVSCGKNGHTIYCTTCNYKSNDVLPHNFYSGICASCGWVCSQHEYVNGEVVQQATCTNDELTRQICSVCGVITNTVTKHATGHNFVFIDGSYSCSICSEQQKITSGDDTTYPLNGRYDADYVQIYSPDVWYEEVDYWQKTLIDHFTGFDTYFCVDPNTQGNGTASNPYIIKTANQFAAVATGFLKDYNNVFIDTEGLYFKIADNVRAFDLNNTDSSVNFSDDDLTAQDVEAELEYAYVDYDLKWKCYNPFKGHFDGNGAQVYGLKADDTYASVFPKVGRNATLKNLTVKNCYFTGNNVSVFFSTNVNPDKTSSYQSMLTILNCQAHNNVLSCTYTSNEAIQNGGILIGQTQWPTESNMVVSDCLVYGNIARHATYNLTYGLVGNLHRAKSLDISNSIVMDCAPHALYYGSNAHFTSSYKQLYTNGIGYEWLNYDCTRTGETKRYVYRYTVDSSGTPRVEFNMYDQYGNNLVNGGNGYDRVLTGSTIYVRTPNEIKSAISLDGISSERWTYNRNDYPTPKIHKSREYSEGRIWSGEAAVKFTEGEGTASVPYCISTAEELALMLTQPVKGAHYKLIADIKINDTTRNNWTQYAKRWFTSNDVPVFEASLDGNGHTVSGIYYDGTQAGKYAGLIPVVGNTAEIRELTIADSVIYADKGAAGAIAGSIADRCGKVIKFNANVVEDSVEFYGNADFAGIIGRIGYSVVWLNDCISKSNGLLTKVSGEAKVKRSISVGAYPFGDIVNIVAENVYTDTYGTGLEGVYGISNQEMQGAAAAQNMAGLEFGTCWNTTSTYPVPTGVVLSANGVKGEPWSGAIATGYAGGTGTKDDPYLIETPEQLALLVTTRYRPGGGLEYVKYYKITADIYVNDVNSKLWKEKIGCIDWFSQYVNGNYISNSHINLDGDGHIIHGLYYDNTQGATQYVRVGLFPILSQYSTIQNLGLSNVYFVGMSLPSSDPNYLQDTMGGFVGGIEDYDASFGLDSHDAAGNYKIVSSQEFQEMTLKIKNCFIDQNSYISAYYTGGFIGSPYSAPILENCLFTGKIGGQSDTYYSGVFTGCDSCYGTQLINCISITDDNVPLVGGSAGSTWRSNRNYWVTFAQNVYYVGKYSYGGDFYKLPSIKEILGAGAMSKMPLFDWKRPDSTETSGWLAVAGRTPIQAIFEKHRSYEELIQYTITLRLYDNDNITNAGNNAFKNDQLLVSGVIAEGVTEIGSEAFYGCTNLESITIPNTVTHIYANAFKNCTSLEKIVIPESVVYIGSDAFAGCTNLKVIVLPSKPMQITSNSFDGTAYYYDNNNWKNGVFYIDNHLIRSVSTYSGELNIKEGTIDIADNAFINCKLITSLTLPQSIKRIGDSAFANCELIDSIPLPDTVLSIGRNAFYNTEYYNNQSNWQNNSLYIGRHLIEVNNRYLTEITLKADTLTIADYALYNAKSIEKISFSDSVRMIGYNAFMYCNKLSSVLFLGTEENWQTIAIADGNEPLLDAEISIVAYDQLPTFVVNDANAARGGTFDVTIDVANNPGIVSTKLMVYYDSDILEIVGAQGGIFADTNFGPNTANPFVIFWVDSINPNNTSNGTVATITFRVKDNVTASETEISVDFDDDDIYNSNFENVYFATQSGTVNIVDYASGDVNADGYINNKDLGLLMQYLNAWKVEINTDVADVNGDGAINNKDLGLLMQYLNGWDVKLQ